MNEQFFNKIIEVYEEVLGKSLVKEKEDKYTVNREIDSLEVMQLMVRLEEEFGIEFNVDELDAELFVDINALSKAIENKI